MSLIFLTLPGYFKGVNNENQILCTNNNSIRFT